MTERASQNNTRRREKNTEGVMERSKCFGSERNEPNVILKMFAKYVGAIAETRTSAFIVEYSRDVGEYTEPVKVQISLKHSILKFSNDFKEFQHECRRSSKPVRFVK